MLAPICLFTYNRLEETKQTVEALRNNYLAPDSELFIFSDGQKNNEAKQKVDEVRKYIKTVDGFKMVKIIESKENKGLANSIINGVTQIIQEYGKVIVLEDDLVSHPYFLRFINDALFHYKAVNAVQSVNGFSPLIKSCQTDIYFQNRPFSWGWGTWIEYWNKDIFDKEKIKQEMFNHSALTLFKKKQGDDIVKMLQDSINGKNDSWYVRWAYNHFKNQRVSLYPRYSLIENIGFSSEATHTNGVKTYKYLFADKCLSPLTFPVDTHIDKTYEKEFLNYFTKLFRLKIRIPLLFSRSGIKLLFKDLLSRI